VCPSKYSEVQFGPRAWYLADTLLRDNYTSFDNVTEAAQASRRANLTKLASQVSFDTCKPPFVRSFEAMSARGASMQIPEHTRESYHAAVRMGAGSLGCEATFLSDKKTLVCRTSDCDLAYTTNILTTSFRSKACTQYTPGVGIECCASKLSKTEFKSLCGTMRLFGDTNAPTEQAYVESLRVQYRETTVYQDGGCSEVMTFEDYISLAKQANVSMVPQLLDVDITGFGATLQAREFATQFSAADKPYVYPQSSNVQVVKEWLASGFANAVFRSDSVNYYYDMTLTPCWTTSNRSRFPSDT